MQAMKQRHTYGATDNIIAEVRCQAGGRNYMMGDEFTSVQAPVLHVLLHGTSPFKKVTIVKDDEEIHIITPNTEKVEFDWTDPKPTTGKTSYYYVRGEQTNEELVWASPLWIKFQPN